MFKSWQDVYENKIILTQFNKSQIYGNFEETKLRHNLREIYRKVTQGPVCINAQISQVNQHLFRTRSPCIRKLKVLAPPFYQQSTPSPIGTDIKTFQSKCIPDQRYITRGNYMYIHRDLVSAPAPEIIAQRLYKH